jgi:hypothetical protein
MQMEIYLKLKLPMATIHQHIHHKTKVLKETAKKLEQGF